MVKFFDDTHPIGQYFTVAASQSSSAIGTAGGATGDYLDSVLVFAAATPGTVAIIDGSTTIGTATPATSGVFPIRIRAYSKTGPWKITTGSNVTVVATGFFT